MSNHLGQGVVGGDFNWSTVGGPGRESCTVKSRSAELRWLSELAES